MLRAFLPVHIKAEPSAWIHGRDWQLSEGTGWKKGEGLAKEHICITHRHRLQCGDGPEGIGGRAGWRWTKWGGDRDIYNNVNNKIKKRIKAEPSFFFYI